MDADARDDGDAATGETALDVTDEEQAWDEAMHQALNLAKAQGKAPGAVEETIRDAHRSTLDWRSLLRRYMTDAAARDYSWSVPNRRFIDSGLYLPSIRSEGMGTLAVIIDTSGSVDTDALAAFWTEVRTVASELEPERVIVLQVDAAVQDVQDYAPGELPERIVVTREGRLWNEFVARYHYLGYKTLVGAQMRYAVHDRNGWPIAMLGFSTAAWKLAPRDNFIGWTPEMREKNLPLVVDNPRFLILPWIEIPNLGSHILAIVRRRLPGDWAERYNTTPVLIETFVQTPRYTGAVYKASGWIPVGTTQGRGRYDRYTKRAQPKKDIWLRPLRKDWKRTLNR